MPQFDRMEDQLAYLIASVNRQLEEQLEEGLRPDGLAIEQFRVINALSSADGRPMRDLASVVFVDPATLTKIIDRMVADAMVYRAPDPKDRRKVLIFLSGKGKALYARHRKMLDDQQERLVERLSAAKVTEFTALLKKFGL
ncbi:MAG: MarR family transcriptional regulator [Methylorubrum populi]